MMKTKSGGENEIMSDRITLSYSGLRAFQNCPRAYLYRYLDRIEPMTDKPRALRAGSAFHAALEKHLVGDTDGARAALVAEFEKANLGDDRVLENRAKTLAMFDAYVERYPADPFTVERVEAEFAAPIVNPDTGAESRTFDMGGKVDGLVTYQGEPWLLEHKTTSLIDVAYVEKLWTDFQIHAYAHFCGVAFGVHPVGVIYNIVQTCQLKKKAEESEADFAVRYADLCAKNKSGKSSATRNLGETWDEYAARVIAWYAERSDPDTGAFQRVFHRFKAAKVAEVAGTVWDLTQALLEARRANRYIRNPSQCYVYNRACDYEPLCRSCDDPLIRANCYRARPALNEELSGNTSDTPDEPAF